MKTNKKSVAKEKKKSKKEKSSQGNRLKKLTPVDYDELCKWTADLVEGKNPACPATAEEIAEDMEDNYFEQNMLPETRPPAESEAMTSVSMPMPLVVPKDQRWTDLTDAGYKLAAAGKFMAGHKELTGPLSMYFSSGAMAMKEKLKGSQDDFNEAVSDIMSGMVVDNLIQAQAANIALMSTEVPFSSDYLNILKIKHQLEGQLLKIIEAKQRLTTIPISIRNAGQVNLGNVNQVLGGNGGIQGESP